MNSVFSRATMGQGLAQLVVPVLIGLALWLALRRNAGGQPLPPPPPPPPGDPYVLTLQLPPTAVVSTDVTIGCLVENRTAGPLDTSVRFDIVAPFGTFTSTRGPLTIGPGDISSFSFIVTIPAGGAGLYTVTATTDNSQSVSGSFTATATATAAQRRQYRYRQSQSMVRR